MCVAKSKGANDTIEYSLKCPGIRADIRSFLDCSGQRHGRVELAPHHKAVDRLVVCIYVARPSKVPD